MFIQIIDVSTPNQDKIFFGIWPERTPIPIPNLGHLFYQVSQENREKFRLGFLVNWFEKVKGGWNFYVRPISEEKAKRLQMTG